MTGLPPPPQVDVTPGRDAHGIRVTGVIDERFQSKAFASLAGRPAPTLIDLDGVTRITSFGVREWMRAIQTLATESCYFVRVRPGIVAQFNSVNNFGGRGHIVSMYCPYSCSNCENAFDVLVDLRKTPEVLRGTGALQIACPRCQSPAEFDDIESTYFGFVSSAPALQVPPAIESLLDGTTLKKPLQVHKMVEGELTVLWLKGTVDKGPRVKRHADGLEGKVLVVLEGVECASADGLEALAELATSPSADVFLARVSLGLIRDFSRRSGGRKPNIISWCVTARCRDCGAEDEVELRRSDAVPGEPRRCTQCGKFGQVIPWTGDDVAAMSAMQLPVVPAEIDAFMRAHADWQTHTSVAGRDVPRHSPSTSKSVEAGARIGKYEVVRRIGFGGMADVLLGKQLGVEGFEKKVVIKRILPHLAQQASFVKMFLEEARVAARLLHTNVVQVYDLIHEGDEYYAILEFVRGADLNVLLKVSTQVVHPVPVEIACRIMSDVCAGLNAAHTYVDDGGAHKPIVHRDVSPHNVLLSTEGAVKITDFGIAKAADSLADDTGTGILKGKVMYMPPEAILGQGADHRVDIYAAAVVLYQCLTGANPFNRGGQAPTMRAVLDETAPDIRNVRPEVPERLAAIIGRGMNRDLAARYQTAGEMGGDLDDFLVSYAKPSGTRTVGAWVKDLIGRGRELNVSLPQNTPSNGQALDEATSVTTPARGASTGIPTGGSDDWFELEELKSQ